MIRSFFCFALCAASLSAQALEFRGSFISRYAYGLHSSEAQLFENVLNTEFDHQTKPGIRFFSNIRLAYDTEDKLEPGKPSGEFSSDYNRRYFFNDDTEAQLREFYIDGYFGDTFYRIGKQAVIWGQADGLQILDVVNPQNYKEFIWQDIDDRRIPLWMINLEMPLQALSLDDWTLQLIWIPDQSYHQIPLQQNQAAFGFRSTQLPPPIDMPGVSTQFNKVEKPDNPFGDRDAGFRLSSFVGGWDISFNYLYHFNDSPVFKRTIGIASQESTPIFYRSRLIGASFSNAFGNFTFRNEVALLENKQYEITAPLTEEQITDNQGLYETNEYASVFGLDYNGLSDTLLSAQIFLNTMEGNEDLINRDKTTKQFSFLVRRDFFNTTVSTELLWVHSVNNHDGSVQVSLDYNFRSNIIFQTAFDFAYGNSNGFFGQFDDKDRWLASVEFHF